MRRRAPPGRRCQRACRRAWLHLALIPGLLGSTGSAAGQTRLAVLEEPQGTAVGLAIVLNAGSAWEMQGEAGLAHLAARAVVEQIRSLMEALGGRATVECDPASIRFTLLLPRATWAQAAELFLHTLFDEPVGADAVAAARAALVREAAVREGVYPRELRTGLARARFGEFHRWARPACGEPETIAAHSVDDVRRIARSRFTPTRATAAVAGPVAARVARAILERWLADTDLPVLVPGPTPGRPGERRRIERSTVTAWVGLAFPFPTGTDAEALRLLGFRLGDAAAPGLARPEVYDFTVEVERHGAGGALVVYLVTAPEQAGRWVDRIAALVRGAAERPLPEPEFESLRRRYAGYRLLGLAAPETRAREAAIQLFFDHAYHPPAGRIAGLAATDLARAAAALGPPAIAVLGPP